MVKMDAERVFVDTNALVYALNPSEPFHERTWSLIDTLEQANCELWINRQVIREYMRVLSVDRDGRRACSADELIFLSRALEDRFLVAEDHRVVTEQLYFLLSHVACGGLQIYDANIVATMLAYGIQGLVTKNVADFRRFSGFIQILGIS